MRSAPSQPKSLDMIVAIAASSYSRKGAEGVPRLGTMKALHRVISSIWTATSNPMRRMAFPLLFLGAGLILVQPCAGAPFEFEQTGSLITARSHHTATLLPNGKVLVAGGLDSSSNSLASAELYDTASGTWTETGDLAFARSQHTATLLPNGKVLVAGGLDSNSNSLASAELYDLASGTWASTGSLEFARSQHTATLLSDGKVLVAAGKVDHGSEPEMETQPDCHPVCRVGTRKAELYDPETGTWARTGNLKIARSRPTATLLLDGNVLVAGGFMGGDFATPTSSAELYDPVIGAWTPTHTLNSPRAQHTATLLPDGEVLAAGGLGQIYTHASAELYDPASQTWTRTGNMKGTRREHTAALLPNGQVFVVGGLDVISNTLASARLYDPAGGRWTEAGNLAVARSQHTSTLLTNGKVLIAGGLDSSSNALASAELYDSAD